MTRPMEHRLGTPPSDALPDDPNAASRFVSRPVVARDLTAIEGLHDRVFGPGALTRAAYRVREGQPAWTLFCRVMHNGDVLVAAVRFTAVRIGGDDGALMLGPLAVAPEYANQGHGRALVAYCLEAARAAGVGAVVLIGDEPYYQRFGFRVAAAGQLTFPGPVDPRRILIAELAPGVAFRGRVSGAE